MRFQNAKIVTASSMIGLLLSSFMVIMGGMSHVKAQETSSSEVVAASGSNRFVVWRDTMGVGAGDIYFRRSTDNGATWKTAVNLSNNPGFSGDPRIAVSGSNVYAAWEQVDTAGTSYDILFRRSLDNGATWGAKVKITPGGTCVSLSSCHQLDLLAATGNSVYLVTEITGDIYLRRSLDNGATWKSAVNISSNPGRSFDPKIAVSGPNVYLAWSQENSAQTSTDILFRRSTDNGAIWKSKINISNNGLVILGFDIGVSGLNVYIAWTDCRPPAGDPGGFQPCEIFSRRSSNNGGTWQAEQNISNTPTEESMDPRIAVVGSKVYVAWKDNIEGESKSADADIFFRRSIDGGSSWDLVINVGHGHNNEDPYECMDLEIAADGTGVHLIWTNAACQSTASIIFSHSNDSGASWSPAGGITGYTNIRAISPPPELAVSGSTVYIVFVRHMSGPGSDIFFGRSTDSGQTWSVPVNLSKTSGISDTPQFGL